ncbi:hypothetical protein JOC94_000148 [Bacillus thermophilus]|uniref:Uncharacterized protein n=1 Tax=Siminovitchia thermophila TaxID=1245522 RepID=A0ABS2R0K9_9BACI|nr:hypothetical protein [Siminovitchia thermophila]
MKSLGHKGKKGDDEEDISLIKQGRTALLSNEDGVFDLM